MASSTIFTRQKSGLDNNVWLIMILFLLCSAGLLGYKVINHKEETVCGELNIVVNGRNNIDTISFFVGQPVTFRSSVSPGDHIVWHFGDTTQNEGSAAVYVFRHDGKFTIRATVNGKCEYYKNIRISPASTVITDTVGNILDDITGKENAVVGETILLSTSKVATSYEWYVENHRNFPQKHTKETSYSFSREDSYIIVLRLDHDNSKRFYKTVNVAGLPDSKSQDEKIHRLVPSDISVAADQDHVKALDSIPASHIEPVKKKYKYITDEILKTYIQSVVCKEMTPEQFNDYLCQGVATPVIVNDKERKTFSQLCSEIQAKKIKIESVKTTRDNENCVINIIVNYDKKWFLGRNPCKN